MDIRRFLIGGNSKPSQPSESQGNIEKRPVPESNQIYSKSLKKSSKYFPKKSDSSSSGTEKIPSSPEPETTKKEQILEIMRKPHSPSAVKPSKPEKSPSLILNQRNRAQLASSPKPESPPKPDSPPPKKPKKSRKAPDPPKDSESSSNIAGKTFVITGLLYEFSRESLTDQIKELGGKVTNTVSKRTTHLIHGYKLEDGREYTAGSKYRKAMELGTNIINEDQIKKWLSVSSPSHNSPSDDSLAQPIQRLALKPNAFKPNDSGSSELWTDKYKPKDLKDLIGNSSVIEKLRNWLEDWEEVVLNKQLKVASPSRSGKFDATTNVNAAAVLISGPPGIGKTTAARLVAAEFGYQVLEMNASVTRNKKLILEPLLASSKSHSLSFNGDIVKNLILMDEIDGMSAGDRGGTAAVIQVIKSTKNPIICICNDRQSQKLKSLANHCYDLHFAKPNKLQVTKRISQILKDEELAVDKNAIECIVEASGNDIRQVLTTFDMWSRTCNSMTYMNAKESLKTMAKDSLGMISVFEAASKLFNRREMEKMAGKDRVNMAFLDYDLIPLLVHENYLSAVGKDDINNLSEAAECISISDVMSREIRQNGNWSILPQYLQLSCINPAMLCSSFVPFPRFPEWFGKFSTQRKNERLLNELKSSISGISSTDPESILTELIPITYSLIMKLLFNDDIEETAESLNSLGLTPDMFKENICGFIKDNRLKDVSAGIKRKLTVYFNANFAASFEKIRKKREGKEGGDKFDPDYQEAAEEEEESEEIGVEAKPSFIKKKRK